ncbi:MAG: PAS domain S-box protein [Desulfobacteraceae bacterium]|nr:MAG: PAS domain S-box protein [Desulfobacteraceae bacterium]
MNEPFDSQKTPKAIPGKIDISGEQSVCETVSTQLRQQLEELKKNKEALETARKNAEASEASLQSLFKAAPVGIGVVVDRKFQFVNHTLCEMLGYPAEAFIGNDSRFIYPSDEEYNLVGSEKYRQIHSMGKGTVETRCLCRDGSIMNVLMSSCPIDPGDLSKGVTFTVLNITEQKNAEKALKLSEEKYRELVENINEVIFVTDLQGAITFVSGKIESILGYSPQEITGKSFTLFVAPEDAELIQTRFKNLISGGGGSNEYRLVHKTGHIIWIRTSTRPTYKNNQIIGAMGTITDITEHKKLAAELQQSRKMEAIGTLAGGIAHDFNNILSAIFGYTELSLHLVFGENVLKQHLTEVLKAASRARDLVKQILAFSRQQENELSDVEPGAVVRETLKFLRSTSPSTIEIRQHINSNGLHIRAKHIQIQQVVMNLCTNAIQSMEKSGGFLEVNLHPVELDTLTLPCSNIVPGLYVKLSIQDTGYGISPQIMPSIFDPYFTTKKIGQGTGLGLSVVHGIIKTLGGGITVQSDIGSGTTFDIYLPAVKSNARGISEIEEELPKGKERILVVDDERIVARANQLRLEQIGYSVAIKTDSEEALELFRENPDGFDLVITDMTMPKMTGDVLAVEMMKIRPGFPVILCTGYSSEISEEMAGKKGIKAFLIKPVALKDLAKIIRKVLDETPAG